MLKSEFMIEAPNGMHARPASNLVRLAQSYSSACKLGKNGNFVKMNSMLNILSLAIKYGDTVTVEVDGPDEQDEMEAIRHFFADLMRNL